MKIDFYILDNATAQKSLHFACGLIEKAYLNQDRVYIHTNSKEEAERLDLLLWTFKDDSFLPHNLYRHDDQSPPPIQIGYENAPKEHTHLLLNLSQQFPDFYPQFNQVIEIVFSDATVQQLARERFKQYREQGHEINTHKLKV